MNDSAKKAILVFGVSFLFLFLFGKKKVKASAVDEVPSPSQREKVALPKMKASDATKNARAKDAYIALTAYIKAYNSKEPQSSLDELNRELMKDMGLKVYRKATTGKFIVTDSSGKEIMEN